MYRIEANENVPNAVKRIANELVNYQLEQLRDENNNRDEVIYETRKAFKQLRALIRIVRSELGEKSYQDLNRYYGDLSAKLAPLREAYIHIETLKKSLAKIEDEAILKAAKAIRKRLMKDYQIVKETLLKEGGAVSQVITELEAHHASIASWSVKRKKFNALESNIERIYKQGQKQMALATKSKSLEDYHNWRKAVKYLWFHLRLLEASNSEALTPYITKLKVLTDALGDAHDLALLHAFLSSEPAWQNKAGQGVLAQILTKQKALEASAKPLGKALYRDKSAQFIKQLRSYWKKWKSSSA